jgi:hypothetical protein
MAFQKVGERYCRLIEQHHKLDRITFLRRVSIVLPELYAAAVALPPEPPSGGPDLLPRIAHEDWNKLFMSLVKLLGPQGEYWLCFNPYAREKPVAGNLADDLADIYRDIKPAVLAFRSKNKRLRKSAVWQWVFGVTNHWGHHATSALRALHQLRSEYRLKKY